MKPQVNQATVYPQLAVACLARNEADRYLISALNAWSQFADQIFVLDDNSTDHTADVAVEAGAVVRRRDTNAPPAWGNETSARRELFEWVSSSISAGSFIFVLDADMVPAKNPKDLLVGGIDGVLFRLHDLWGEGVYRSDHYWRGHNVPRLWLVRNPRTTDHQWSGRGIHSGHFPNNLLIERSVVAPKEYSILHYSYVDPVDRKSKCDQYMQQFDNLTTHEWVHAASINDPDPRLFDLDIGVTWPLRKSSSDAVSDKTP
jgi:glycosyltransferase involved in cell wall biosynthesis